MQTDDRNRAWLEVRAASLQRNFRRIRDAVGLGVRMLPMVKADAYGLGAVRVARLLSEETIAGFGVAAVAEAERLRDAGVEGRVIVFTPLAPGEEARAAGAEAEIVCGSAESVRRAIDAGLTVHLEIDTGMGRAGVPFDALPTRAQELRDLLLRGDRWAGVFTHLHSADEPGAPEVALQLTRFAEAVARLDPPSSVACHIANSAGALLRAMPRGIDLHLARPGVHLYGGGSGTELSPPDPVISLRARVVRVEDVLPGTTAGYGATYRAETSERWATLAIGYADGLPRALSNRGCILVAGRCRLRWWRGIAPTPGSPSPATPIIR